jgi:S1-C subfamily serine protease
MKSVFFSLMTMILSIGWAEIHAADVPPAQASIVKVRAFIAADARTAGSLGRQREGSGVVIDADGHILTIGYLILEAEAIEVIRPDGQSIVASYVGYDHATGFGILKASQKQGLTPIIMGSSSRLQVGEPILLVGHGGAGAIRPATLIARMEFAGYWEYLLDEAFYVAPPHPEFAGVAMLNPDGRLMGIGSIYTQMVFPQYGTVVCNMFVPIDLLKPILNDLIQKGRAAKPPQPWLGLNADETHGRVFVERVHSGSPAEMAGLKKNDIILSVNQEKVTGLADFYRKVWALGRAGVQVPLSVLQGNQIKKIDVLSSDRYQYLRIRPTRKAPHTIIEKSI